MKLLLQTQIFCCLMTGATLVSAIDSPATASTNSAALRQISPGVFQIGEVRLNRSERTVRFPAAVNMTNGLVEYFLVTGTGKLHESVLKTEVEPAQIHVAMLLLGAPESSTNAAATNIAGSPIAIQLDWKDGIVAKKARGEEWVFNKETKLPVQRGDWIYNGSKVLGGTFIAQRDGSIVSIIADPLALANNTRAGNENDEIWFVNTNAVPAFNTPVEVTFRLAK